MTDTGLTPDAPEKNKGLTPEKQMLKDMAVALFDTIQRTGEGPKKRFKELTVEERASFRKQAKMLMHQINKRGYSVSKDAA
ncbi:MAG: hypothetical protein CMK07_06555 [Ponticaulis sp.]|nr:hypothetical protein [Ponticaulis sp.]